MAGGKTGTAEKSDVPMIRPENGRANVRLKRKKTRKAILSITRNIVTYDRMDGWFICIAPLENPQVAIAVVIEDIGSKFGGQTAAPVAANVILKARALGLLGDRYTPKPPPANPSQEKKKG